MDWVLIVFVLWHSTEIKQYEIEMSSEDVCHEAMFMIEQKLLSDSFISEHDGYTLTCKPKEEK